MTNHIVFSSVLAAALSAGMVAVALAQHDSRGQARILSTTFEIPNSLKVEHEALHGELSAATKFGGKTGAAAQRVATLLHGHFVSKERVRAAAARAASSTGDRRSLPTHAGCRRSDGSFEGRPASHAR
jgi:hypothetical protein